MISVRLTKEMRDKIVYDILAHAFLERSKAQLANEQVFAQKVYDYVMKTDMIKLDGGKGEKVSLGKAISMLPTSWRTKKNEIRVSFDHMLVVLKKEGGLQYNYGNLYRDLLIKSKTLDNDEMWEFQPGNKAYQVMMAFDEKDNLTVEYNALKEKREALMEEIKLSRISARTIVNGVSTTKRLAETWPEIEQFLIPHVGKATPTNLPATVTMADLNTQLGLPPEETT